jgi:cardiolipin synthase A/B
MHARIWLVSCALLAACATPAHTPKLDEVNASGPLVLETADGPLSAERSRAILASLANETGASDILLRHLAVEQAITESPLVVGNKVTLLRDGPATYKSMYQAISGAKSSINVEVYMLENDDMGKQLVAVLAARQESGIQVNLMYDSIGSMHTPPEFFKRLTDAGAKVVEFNPVNPAKARKDWIVDHRDHRKLTIVDGQIAFTGGINFSSVYSGGSFSRPKRASGADKVPWRDTQVRIEGPVVAEFQKLFLATWEKQKGDPLPPKRYLVRIERKGDQIVRAVGSTPDSKISILHTTLLSAIANADRSIHLTNAYFVPDQELLDQLKAAARRGVDVKLLLPGRTDFWAPLYAGRSHYSDLLKAGVKIYERQDALLHAKTAVIDGVWSTVGSSNLDPRSFATNDEIDAVVLGEDFAEQMEAMFQADIAEATAVTPEEWTHRGLGTRMKETAARLLERWL